MLRTGSSIRVPRALARDFVKFNLGGFWCHCGIRRVSGHFTGHQWGWINLVSELRLFGRAIFWAGLFIGRSLADHFTGLAFGLSIKIDTCFSICLHFFTNGLGIKSLPSTTFFGLLLICLYFSAWSNCSHGLSLYLWVFFSLFLFFCLALYFGSLYLVKSKGISRE